MDRNRLLLDKGNLELKDFSYQRVDIGTIADAETEPVTEHGHTVKAVIADAVKPGIKAIALWEIALFGILCTADMLSTVYWYTHGQALEANPVLAYWLNKSVAAFCIAKLATFGPLLIACAILRERYARVITPGLRIAMASYVAIYVCSVLAQIL